MSMTTKEIKVCLLGDLSVGKSCIAKRFTENVFLEKEVPSTTGVEFTTRNMIVDNIKFKIHIWDTAGSEQYRSLLPMYYRGAAASFLVFDITARVSFESLDKWMLDITSVCPKDMMVIVVGNKSDLSSQRKVAEDELKTFASTHGLKYFESSAKTGENVEEMFIYACRHISPQLVKVTKPAEYVRLEDAINKDKKGCCSSC